MSNKNNVGDATRVKLTKTVPAEYVGISGGKHHVKLQRTKAASGKGNTMGIKRRNSVHIKTKIKPRMSYSYDDEVKCIKYSKDGQWLACAVGKKVIIYQYDEKIKTVSWAFEQPALIYSCSFSPNSEVLSVASGKELTLYDLATGEKRHVIKSQGTIYTCDFSPNNGDLLAAGGDFSPNKKKDLPAAGGDFVETNTDDDNNDICKGSITVYNVVSYAKVHMFKHKDLIRTCKFIPNTELLGVGDNGGNFIVYNVNTRKREYEFGSTDSHAKLETEYEKLKSSKNCKLELLSLMDKYEMRRNKTKSEALKVKNIKQLIEEEIKKRKKDNNNVSSNVRRELSDVYTCDISPNGELLAVGGVTGMESLSALTIYHIPTQAKQFVLTGLGIVRACSFSNDGKLLAVGDCVKNAKNSKKKGTVTIYHVATGAKLHVFMHVKIVFTCMFSYNGEFLAVGDGIYNRKKRKKQGTMTLYRLHAGAKQYVLKHKCRVNTCKFSLNEKLLVVGESANRTPTYEEEKKGLYAFEHIYEGASLTIYLLETGEQKHVFENQGGVTTCNFSPNGELIAVGGGENGNILTVYDIPTGNILFNETHENVHTVEFSPNGKLLAVGYRDTRTHGILAVYNLEKRKRHCTFKYNDKGSNSKNVHTCMFLLNSEVLAAGSSKLRFYDVTGHVDGAVIEDPISICTFSEDTVTTCTFSPDRQLVAVGFANKKVTVYYLPEVEDKSNVILNNTEEELKQKLIFECKNQIYACAFSPNGELLVVGDDVGVVIYFLETGAVHYAFEHKDAVNSCHFSSNSELLAVGDENGKVIVYSLKVDPLPSEISFDYPNVIAFRRYLVHRQNSDGDTILHLLVQKGSNDQLRSFLHAAKHDVYPIANSKLQTPLHKAIERSDHKKAEILLNIYLAQNHAGLQPLCDVLKAYPNVFSDLRVTLLKKSKRKVHTSNVSRLIVRKTQYKSWGGPGLDGQNIWTKFDEQKGGREVAVIPYMVGFPQFLARDGPFNSIVRSKNLRAFETDAMKYAVDYKWKTYGRSLQLFFVSFYLTMFVMFTVGQLTYVANVSYLPWLLVASLIAVIFLIEEIVQLTHNMSDYMRSGWNILDILVYIMVIASTVVSTVSMDDNAIVSIISGWTFILLSINFLNFLRPFDYFGSLIRMITQIFADMKNFIVIQLIFLVGFTLCFMIMLTKNEAFAGAFAFLTGYEMMLGDWDMENFQAVTIKKFNDTDVEIPNPLVTSFAIGAFCLYMFLVPIVTMNLLIAIMGDSYDRVRDNEVVEGRLQKAEILADMDKTWGFWLARNPIQRKKNYPRCFHVLEPEGLQMHDEVDWEGSLKALRKALNESDMKIHTIQKEIHDKTGGLEKKVDALDKKLDVIIKHLTHLD